MQSGLGTSEHTHDFAEFFLVTNGIGWHFWNGQKRALQAGQLVYIHPTDRHFFQGADEGSGEFINLALSPRWWAAYSQLFTPVLAFERQAAGHPAGHCLLSLADAQSCERRLRRLLGGDGGDEALLAETVSGLVRVLRQPTADTVKESGCPEWLSRWVEDMRDPQRISDPLDVWQKRSGRSPEHLSRSCRRFFGLSPTDLLNHSRIEYVKAALLRGDDKVINLAFDAGYQNVGYFYRTFRRLENCTPKEWLAARSDREVVPR